MATMTVLDSAGSPQTVEKPLTPGQAVMTASRPVVIASDQSAIAMTNAGIGAAADASASSDTGTFSLIALFKRALGYLATIAANAASALASPIIMSLPYQAVAVSQTAHVLGATGAAGDTLQGIVIQPTGTTVGSVVILDGSTAVYTYPGGTVGADLRPIIIGLGMVCVGAGWHVTTPSNATVLALGKFT